MLHHLAIKVGDVTTTTQVVWVVVELHLLVCVAFLEVILCSSRQSSCLRSLQAAVIAAEALAVHIVVVVLAIVGTEGRRCRMSQHRCNTSSMCAARTCHSQSCSHNRSRMTCIHAPFQADRRGCKNR